MIIEENYPMELDLVETLATAHLDSMPEWRDELHELIESMIDVFRASSILTRNEFGSFCLFVSTALIESLDEQCATVIV